MRLRNMIGRGKDPAPTECQDGAVKLKDIDSAWSDGKFYNGLPYEELFTVCGKLEIGSAAYAVAWQLLIENKRYCNIPYGTDVHIFRFRRVGVSPVLTAGETYSGKVRIGVDRPSNLQNIPSEKLDVVIYDGELNVLAKVASYDWSAGDLRMHIGDTAEDAVMFCGKGGWHSCEFLYMAVVWHSDLQPYKFARDRFKFSCQSRYFLKVDAPEALSDLMVGECFYADLLDMHDGSFGLTRSGFNYRFADVPNSYGEAVSSLKQTGYPKSDITCMCHGKVVDGVNEIDMVEVLGMPDADIKMLARFRRESGLDLRYDDDYETLHLPKVEAPLPLPFDIVRVKYVSVPLAGRKNPAVEFRINDIVIDSAKYHDGQKLGHESKYNLMLERSGKESVWARLHYDENDIPYLNIVWELRDHLDSVDEG